METETMRIPAHQIMVDIETKGCWPNSAIVSIGAVAFGPKYPDFLDAVEFYRVITMDSCIRLGLGTDPETITWWANQDQKALAEHARKDAFDLANALRDFSRFMVDVEAVWSRMDFDAVILANAFRACSLPQPWDFKQNRDWPTFRKLFSAPSDEPPWFEKETPHIAVDDARHQARWAAAIMSRMGWPGGWVE